MGLKILAEHSLALPIYLHTMPLGQLSIYMESSVELMMK